jgi:uncharacterized OsmC-like protein
MKKIDVTFPGGKKVDAHYDGRTVHTDQSVRNGGEGSAPEPFDLFFVSLATCVGIYALEFCAARELETEGLGVSLTAERHPEEKRYAKVTIELSPPAGFPDKYRSALRRAADLCTVKKHILTPPTFEVILAGE